VTVAASSHPVCLLGDDGAFHFIRTAATLSFLVPPGAGEFGVRITGGGGEELVRATLFDPAGRRVWHEDAVGQARCFVGNAASPGQAGEWRLRLEKPTRGAFEDHYVELRGVPAVLFFTKDTLPERREP
jgi:hypothetical protein